ncbi:hypothetical protein EHQ76_13235 [Leptospira barantonii]|uniref:GGDEF domain-containing protein n=1 Tax=Leptospira barantonii TaxID=2023184 RepID=A0A5F2B136_9LEPT|nr:hypothetical protein [Leptospira barantonii]TGL98147.1 hypothetical protein EHQ76_13235 [Leptospira barantonii]
MKIQYFGIIFVFFNCSLGFVERQTSATKTLFTGDTLVLSGISISLLFLFGLVLKESVQKSSNGESTPKQRQPSLETETKTELLQTATTVRSERIQRIPARVVWKREVPTHPELILAHGKFLEQLASRLGGAEIYFLSGNVSILLASRKGKLFHLPESPEESFLSEKNLNEIHEGRICFAEGFAFIPLSTGIVPFGYLKVSLTEWNQLNPREFQTWKEEYEEQVSIQFESSDPETGFGNLHAFELDKIRAHENILIFASIFTESPHPYVLKWISLWTSKILKKRVRFYRIRKDRIAFFISAQDWDVFGKNLKELIESLQKESHRVDLNLGVSILEESREEWVSNARKALALSIEQGPNRYICL